MGAGGEVGRVGGGEQEGELVVALSEVLHASGGRLRGRRGQQRRRLHGGPAAAGQVRLVVGADVSQAGGRVEGQQAGLVDDVGSVGQRRHRHAAGRAIGGQGRRVGGGVGRGQCVIQRQRALDTLAEVVGAALRGEGVFDYIAAVRRDPDLAGRGRQAHLTERTLVKGVTAGGLAVHGVVAGGLRAE